MPVYNELATVERAIERVLAVDASVDRFELIVVDDGSTDGTRELLATRNWPESVRILHHERNRGKGAALRTGLGEAGGEYCTVMDADLEYDPSNLGALLAPLLAGEADAVYGVRGFQAQSAYSFWYVIGNKTVTLAANILYNAWLSDLMTCQKVLKTSLFRESPAAENGFAIECRDNGAPASRRSPRPRKCPRVCGDAASKGKKLRPARRGWRPRNCRPLPNSLTGLVTKPL